MIKELNLRNAKFRLDQIENKIDYLKQKKAEIELIVMPKAKPINEIMVDGGKIAKDKLLEYTCKIDEIQNEMHQLIVEYKNLNKWYMRELEIIGKMDPLIKEIILCREEKHMTWERTAGRIGYSRRQCINIYNKWRKEENND